MQTFFKFQLRRQKQTIQMAGLPIDNELNELLQDDRVAILTYVI